MPALAPLPQGVRELEKDPLGSPVVGVHLNLTMVNIEVIYISSFFLDRQLTSGPLAFQHCSAASTYLRLSDQEDTTANT
jgi:hypothetical protein